MGIRNEIKRKMTKELTTSKKELEKIKIELDLLKSPLKVGDIIINEHGYYKKIQAITSKGIRFLKYEGNDNWEKYEYDSKYPWNGTTDWQYIKNNEYIVINKIPEDFEKQCILEISDTDYDDEIDDNEDTNETALVTFNKDYLVHQKNKLQEKRDKFEILTRIMNKKRNEMQHYVGLIEEKIRKVMKVLATIELYLGIDEEIFQLQSGQKAPTDTPINVRQQILYMDEEIGVYENQGLDYEDIKEFDEWLLVKKNYIKLIPEEKGLVVIRMRRKDKDYGGSPIQNHFANQPNKETYLLIRNGDCLYRIHSSIIIKPRMFPKHEELQELLTEPKKNEWNRDKEERENKLFSYKKNLIFLQGLLDRTDVFKPIKKPIDLFKVESYDESDFRFIYDDELTLPDGRLPYKDWKKEINSKIKRGTRIYFCGFMYCYGFTGNERESRYPFRTFNEPDYGVYSVKRIEPAERWSSEKIICHFLPNDEIYDNNYESHKRKQSIPFYLYTSDKVVLNYDLMTISDIDYYIHNRYERRHYLDMLPVLKKMRKERVKEMKWEKGFVDNLAIKFKCDPKIVWDIIKWWKVKVIWKRPIIEDDTKALRMITSRLKKELNM